MTDPYYVSIRPGDYRAVVGALRAAQAGRLQGLRFHVQTPSGLCSRPAMWLQPWDVLECWPRGYWLRATRGDYTGPDGRALDAIVGYSHRDAHHLR